MELRTVYVTVGTTKFYSLINEITSDRALKLLKARGCRKLILQLGSGRPVDDIKIHQEYGIEVEQYEFKFETTRTDILLADLVIGHAGAGTCMDILEHGKPGLIVVNEELMDNHQTELARQLAAEGYIYYCTVGQLVTRLEALDLGALKRYEQTENLEKFVECLNELMMN